MEPPEHPAAFPEDTWILIFSLIPSHIIAMSSMTNKFMRTTFVGKKSFWNALWRKSGFSLPESMSHLSSREKFQTINTIMKASEETITGAVVDQARISRIDGTGFPHGSQTVVTTHSEDIPYSYHGMSNLCANFWDLSQWPTHKYPTSVELAYLDVETSKQSMMLVGKNFLGRRGASRRIGFTDLKMQTEPVSFDFTPPHEKNLIGFNLSQNMNSDYPWVLVVCGDAKLHLWIADLENDRWTSDKPVVLPASAEDVSISFYGPWVAVLTSSTRRLDLWRLDSTGKPPEKPQLSASLRDFPCSLERGKIQLAVSLHRLALFYIRTHKTEHARLLSIQIDSSFSDTFQHLIYQAEKESMVFDSVDPTLTSQLFVTATENLVFASIRQDMFIVDPFKNRVISIVRASLPIMSIARAVDSALFVIPTQASLIAVDLLGRETGYEEKHCKLQYYQVFIDAKGKVRVEEEICRGSELMQALERVLPQDKDHGRIEHTILPDPCSKDKNGGILILTRGPMKPPAAPGLSIVDETWAAINTVVTKFTDSPIQIMSPEKFREEAKHDSKFAQLLATRPSWARSNGPPIPEAVMIRIPALLQSNDAFPWSLEKASQTAEAFVTAGSIKSSHGGDKSRK